MTKIVASRYWTCEECGATDYDLYEMLSHLKDKHGVNPENVDKAADNLFMAELFTRENGCRPNPEFTFKGLCR